MRRLKATGRVAASIAAIVLVTAVYYRLIQVNPTTVALSYLIVILLIASGWGIAESTTASVVAMFCFNFFFLPPIGTLTIADPQNWVALAAFLVTAIVTSQLSGRAKRRNVEALARQNDLERLYALSRALLLSERGASMPAEIARHIADAFTLAVVALYDQRTDTISWAGPTDIPAMDTTLREVARRATSQRSTSGLIVTAIQLGGTPIGSLALSDAGLSDTVLQSIANLAAIGLERARAIEATARAEAAREGSELRATVLDALAHEFKTPLTTMRAASSDLLASVSATPKDRELVAIIDEELGRLGALVTDAVQMLRIDAGQFAIHLGRHDLHSIVTAALKTYVRQLDGHSVIERIPEGLTVDADRDLLGLALRQLLDNAVKYSPPASTIELCATTNGTVNIAVRNSGSLIHERDRARVFERFYRGAQARQIPGTGMGLSIVQQIADAHGGSLNVASAAETGTTFTISLPRGATQP